MPLSQKKIRGISVKKLMSVLVGVSVLAVASFAESVESLKSKICIVREVYFDETKNYCLNAAEDLKSKNFPNHAKYIEDYLGNTFGSGFLYVAKDGTNYVITNRHVVQRCEGATVEFPSADGEFTKYEKHEGCCNRCGSGYCCSCL